MCVCVCVCITVRPAMRCAGQSNFMRNSRVRLQKLDRRKRGRDNVLKGEGKQRGNMTEIRSPCDV